MGSASSQSLAICFSMVATSGSAACARAPDTSTRATAVTVAAATRKDLGTRAGVATANRLLLPTPPTGLADGFGREDLPYRSGSCGFTPSDWVGPRFVSRRLGGVRPRPPGGRPVTVGRWFTLGSRDDARNL